MFMLISPEKDDIKLTVYSSACCVRAVAVGVRWGDGVLSGGGGDEIVRILLATAAVSSQEYMLSVIQ